MVPPSTASDQELPARTSRVNGVFAIAALAGLASLESTWGETPEKAWGIQVSKHALDLLMHPSARRPASVPRGADRHDSSAGREETMTR